MTTDFEYKLKENLTADIDATNKDVLSEIMKTPFAQKQKRFNFWNMPKRAVATICASVLLLCVGVFASDLLSSNNAAAPMPMSMNDMSRTIESAEINISDSLQQVLLESEMSDVIEVAVLSSFSSEEFIELANLGRTLSIEDFNYLTVAQPEVIIVEIEKSSIINMKDYFYFMLPSEA